jgi:AAA+ superfamily predicted ATPase
MGIENFITDALYKPNDYIAYHVGRELAELYPGKGIIEGETGYFDLEEFVRAERCEIVYESSIFNHIRTDWYSPNERLREAITNSWLNVLWRGQLLDVVILTFTEGCYSSRHHWIVADDKSLATAFFKEVCEWTSEVRGEVLVFQDGEWTKNKKLFNAIKSATFSNLVLVDSLKREIKTEFAQFFQSRDVYEKYGIPWKRGVLFIGPPGNGKTHTVKALINELGHPCLYVKSFKSEYGTEEENMRLVFARARTTTPCLLVLEDLDSMITNESRSFFLNELDGFETNNGVVVLATTNHPERLDPAILDRPSRFDRKYYFHLPAEAERQAYIARWNTQLQSELRLTAAGVTDLVKDTDGFSFAYIKEVFLSSMMHWLTAERASMDKVARAQAAQLREQMSAIAKAAKAEADNTTQHSN